MRCQRCGAAAVGASCTGCGAPLPFAPPRIDEPPVTPIARHSGFGWLVAAGIGQALLGCFWIIFGVILSFGIFDRMMGNFARRGEDMHVFVGTVSDMGWVVAVLGGAIVVVSICVILRRRWAYFVSLAFDSLWALLCIAMTFTGAGVVGLIYLLVASSLLAALIFGRPALAQ